MMIDFNKTDAIAHQYLEAKNPAAFLANAWTELTAAESRAVLAHIEECEERARMMVERSIERFQIAHHFGRETIAKATA